MHLQLVHPLELGQQGQNTATSHCHPRSQNIVQRIQVQLVCLGSRNTAVHCLLVPLQVTCIRAPRSLHS